MIQEILREKWGFEGYYVSDCGAIKDFHKNHMITKDEEESAALALKSGCDLNCGAVYLYALAACEKGLLGQEDIDKAVKHLMMTRMRLGMFDTETEYDAISYEENDTPMHHERALKAAEESMVLLKNDGILPLKKENLKVVAVIGPNGDSREILKGNCYGTLYDSGGNQEAGWGFGTGILLGRMPFVQGKCGGAGRSGRPYFRGGFHGGAQRCGFLVPGAGCQAGRGRRGCQ